MAKLSVALFLVFALSATATAQEKKTGTGFHDHQHGPGPCKWCEQTTPEQLSEPVYAPVLTPPKRAVSTPVLPLFLVITAGLSLVGALIIRRMRIEKGVEAHCNQATGDN